MVTSRRFIALSTCILGASLTLGATHSGLKPAEKLGEDLFFEEALSSPPGQSCAACHGPTVGWTGPNPLINQTGAVYEGAFPGRFGNRKPTSSAYATTSPLFDFDPVEGLFLGGNFWDGRATGWTLGNPAADQALGPPLNPVEQNNSSPEEVCEKAVASTPGGHIRNVFGHDGLDCAPGAAALASFHDIGRVIAVYEDSLDVNAFDSKYDAYLVACVGAGHGHDDCARGAGPREALDAAGLLTDIEWTGLQLFVAGNDNDGILMPGEGGNCAACHSLDWTTTAVTASQVFGDGSETRLLPPQLTDYTYDNIGTPRNPDNPFYDMAEVFIEQDGALVPINPQGEAWVDPGLGGFLRSLSDPGNQGWRQSPFVTEAMAALTNEQLVALAAESQGKMKVPTLRNVNLRPSPGFPKAYTHNGVFKSLESVVHFYNTRDALPVCEVAGGEPGVTCWPEPEVAENINVTELGNLGLDAAQEAAIVAFMRTLDDGYHPGKAE